MERLRDMKVADGSVEGMLVEAIKASQPVEISHALQQRVLERVLERQRARRVSPAVLLRPIVVVGLLLVAGVTAAATAGHDWIARGLRAFGHTTRTQALATEPAARPRRSRLAELPALDPVAIAAEEPAPIPTPPPTSVRPASRPVIRARATTPEDPSLVVDAIRALRTDHDPARAGKLTSEYLRTYPHGALSEEAIALSIEAAAARKSPKAAAFAEQYLKDYPNGRFRRAAEQALEQQRP